MWVYPEKIKLKALIVFSKFNLQNLELDKNVILRKWPLKSRYALCKKSYSYSFKIPHNDYLILLPAYQGLCNSSFIIKTKHNLPYFLRFQVYNLIFTTFKLQLTGKIGIFSVFWITTFSQPNVTKGFNTPSISRQVLLKWVWKCFFNLLL